MKPVNKTRRTVEHSGMIEECSCFCRNARRIIRAKSKRASRKADRWQNKIVAMTDRDLIDCDEFNFEQLSEPEYNVVRYQDGFRVWYR